jgi:cephalosporin hydroxylase
LIVDDGSHRSEHVIASFEVLFPLLARGGLYVIEDAHRSYIPSYGGGPPGTDGTTIEFVKRQIDDLVRRLPEPGGAEPAATAIHVYPRIVFIEKSE